MLYVFNQPIALPCDSEGNFLPPGALPPPRPVPVQGDWTPFDSEVQFMLAELLYRRAEVSATNINTLLEIWAQSLAEANQPAPFKSHEHMHAKIDASVLGDVPWQCFVVNLSADVDDHSPEWMRASYEVWYRDPDVVVTNMLSNPDFAGQFDLRPYINLDARGKRRWSNVMSGNIAWRHSVWRSLLSADVLMGTSGAWCTTSSLSSQTTLEQAMLTGIVQGWCPKCTVLSGGLELHAGCRTPSLTNKLIHLIDTKTLWTDYGINSGIVPFTSDFPRADIYEMISPDILHQVIKGTFKDHLVTWIGHYLSIEHGKTRGDAIMDDIDRRIAAVPPFPGLHRFPQGRRFKQWTGDDSKALMKVYLPAIVGHVPEEIVMCLSAFLDACYIIRRNDINSNVLSDLDAALGRFSDLHEHSLVHYWRQVEDFGAPGGLCSSITESRHITTVKKPWCPFQSLRSPGSDVTAGHAPLRYTSHPHVPERSRLNGNDSEGEDEDEGPVEGDIVMGHVTLARMYARQYPRDIDETFSAHRRAKSPLPDAGGCFLNS
ncbi:hypothetical protein H4582DRAFT_2081203 [Lactarius indigo]|nr:hypothetical protein H4582DRAFT_2081203 [Lactarius indigo]